MGTQHTPATRRIQSHLERMELEHLRTLVAEQGDELEELRERVYSAERCAESWRDDYMNLQEHLNDGTADVRRIGLTQSGELLVVREGALQ
ncbi:hypothetical protein [Hydrogenophaga sp.]|uniref:hypothetical protein n=1 Tax=Hydrogenophaga sp. TaxID=1904254 RepID=UPI003D0C8593